MQLHDRRGEGRQPSVPTLRPARDFGLLIVIAAGTAAVLGVQSVAGAPGIDAAARSVASLHVHPLLNDVMTGITALGAEVVLLVAGATLALWAYRRRGARWARFFAVVTAGALLLDNIVKPLVGRARPAFDQLVAGRGESWPSGHTVGATALLFALAYYLGHHRSARARTGLWTGAVFGSGLMAASRVYVGVHWPTDAIAGVVLGALWTLMCARSQRVAPGPARNEPVRPARTWRQRMVPVTVAFGLVAVACSPSSGGNETEAASETPVARAETLAPEAGPPYEPNIDPANFVSRVDNPYFPLEPGTVFRLRGDTEDGLEHETITVTDRTKEVMGVETTVIKDVMRVDGEITESTYDWYAQDKEGNVWYFGEDTAEYENGKILNRHGSWEAGVDGALPGIIMNAHPQVTDSFRQEYYEGEAEDMYWVVATGETKSTPLGKFDDVIRTLEWNPLEPGVIVEKTHAPGYGLISERALSGGKENVELLEVTRP